MTLLIAIIRKVRREVPGAAAVVTQACTAQDDDDPGKPQIAWDDAEARTVLIDALVKDALALEVLAGWDQDDSAKAAGAQATDSATGIRLLAADGTITSDTSSGEPVHVLGDSAHGTGDALARSLVPGTSRW